MQLELSTIESLNAQLIAISPQIPDQSLTLLENQNLKFDILSDAGNKVARQFGLVFTLPEKLRPVYNGFGIDLPKANGDDSFELPVPATYVINKDGNIVCDFVEIDHTKRIEPDMIVDALKSLVS